MSRSGSERRAAVHEHWKRLEMLLIGLLVLIAIALFLYGSFVRTLAPALAMDWSEEVTIYLIVWATLLCGGTLASEREHVSAQIVEPLLSERARRRLQLGVDLLTLAFCTLMLWLGAQAVWFAHGLDERSASTLEAPQAWALYLALPVGMLLTLVRLGALLLRDRSGAHG